MHGLFAKNCPLDSKAKFMEVDSLQEMFPFAKNYGRDCEMYFVDVSAGQIMADHRHATAHTDLLFSGRFPGLLQRGLRPISNKVERSAALHL